MDVAGMEIVVLFLLAFFVPSFSGENRTLELVTNTTTMPFRSSSLRLPVNSTLMSNTSKPLTVSVAVPAMPSSATSTVAATPSSQMASVTTSTKAPSEEVTSTPILPVKHLWNVTSDGYVCILFESGIRMTFNYLLNNKSSSSNVTGAKVDVPVDAISHGVCGENSQSITLSFFSDWQLVLTFTRNASVDDYYVSGLSLSYTLGGGRSPFPQAAFFNETAVRSTDDDSFSSEVGTSFICTSQQNLLQEDPSRAVGVVSVSFYDTRVEAFRSNTTSAEFAVGGGRCSDDELSLLVPIIVGACLAALIVLVLVAYFIGRHHSKRGYENV